MPLRYLLPGLLILLAVSCGGRDGDAIGESAGEESGSLFQTRLIANPGGSYSLDDLVSIGYKKSRQIELDTLPDARDAWFGFFDQKNVEVWFFDSHEDALDYGVDTAEEVLLQNPSYWYSTAAIYPAYAVFGNLVMLCETALAICEALIAELE